MVCAVVQAVQVFCVTFIVASSRHSAGRVLVFAKYISLLNQEKCLDHLDHLDRARVSATLWPPIGWTNSGHYRTISQLSARLDVSVD
jgi:hypothetical protein